MGYITSLYQGRLAGMDASPFCRVYEGISIACSTCLYEPGGRSFASGEGVVQRGIYFMLAGAVRTISGMPMPYSSGSTDLKTVS
jgi:hypothetical protein